jgi:hypothetical protein
MAGRERRIMNRSSIINAAKETILEGGTIPATFFVDHSGLPLYSLMALPTCDCCGVTEQHALMVGRRTALEQRWQYALVNECGLVHIEKREGREFLVIVFCVPGESIAFSVRSIEIRRAGSSVVLLDNEEEHTIPHRLLLAFLAGLASSAVSGMEGVIATFIAKGITARSKE